MQWLKKWGLPGLAIGIIIIGVGLQFIARMQPVPEGSLDVPLGKAIPRQLPGWSVKELDLGPTESVSQRSHDLLRLDDFVHRSYHRGNKAFSVYVAYWKPGKMPVRLVNQHSPDRCWTEVGWTCTDREWNIEKTVGGVPLQPAQWGVYEKDGLTNYTYFWHIVGGKVHWYGGKRLNTQSSLTSIWEDFRKFGLNVHREQFFIRIVSPAPIEQVWDEPGFQEVLQDLAKLCLAEPAGSDTLAAK